MVVDEIEVLATLDSVGLGEASLEDATAAISTLIARRDDLSAALVYDALRGWTWKALESRRRDEGLSGWVALMGTVVSLLERRESPLAAKLEAFVELLQPSLDMAALQREEDPLRRKHVRDILVHFHEQRGTVRKRDLMAHLALAEANVTRIMGPLIDRGWFQRIVEGRVVIYRLTEAGRVQAAPLHAEWIKQNEVFPPMVKPDRIQTYVTALSVDFSDTLSMYGKLPSDYAATGGANYAAVIGQSNIAPVIPLTKTGAEFGQTIDLHQAAA